MWYVCSLSCMRCLRIGFLRFVLVVSGLGFLVGVLDLEFVTFFRMFKIYVYIEIGRDR